MLIQSITQVIYDQVQDYKDHHYLWLLEIRKFLCFVRMSKISESQVNFFSMLLYSLINRRRLHIFFTQAKTWHWIVCWFSWISLNSPVFAWCDHKIVLFWSAEQFYDFDVKFWLNWRKYGAVSYWLSCTCFYHFLHDVIIKLFCRSKQNNFMITSWKNW